MVTIWINDKESACPRAHQKTLEDLITKRRLLKYDEQALENRKKELNTSLITCLSEVGATKAQSDKGIVSIRERTVRTVPEKDLLNYLSGAGWSQEDLDRLVEHVVRISHSASVYFDLPRIK